MNSRALFTIRTPEGVVFSQVLASPLSRFLAWLIDFIIVFAAISFFGSIIGFLARLAAPIFLAVGILMFFIVPVAYGIFFEWRWRGQTFGKRMLRLRVIDADGLRLRFSQIVMRNLLRVVDQLPSCYLLGGAVCILNPRLQRLGDLAANTLVIHIPTPIVPDLDQITTGKFNSLRLYPHLEARLRQRVSAAEGSIALRAILRRDKLEPEARLKLFTVLADDFRQKVEFPPEATAGMADEQYVRCVIEILYRPRHRSAEGLAKGSSEKQSSAAFSHE